MFTNINSKNRLIQATFTPLVKEFSAFASDAIKQVRCLKKQNQKIQQARDLLLPRLMNGEIAV